MLSWRVTSHSAGPLETSTASTRCRPSRRYCSSPSAGGPIAALQSATSSPRSSRPSLPGSSRELERPVRSEEHTSELHHTEIYTLSLHDALPISPSAGGPIAALQSATSSPRSSRPSLPGSSRELERPVHRILGLRPIRHLPDAQAEKRDLVAVGEYTPIPGHSSVCHGSPLFESV